MTTTASPHLSYVLRLADNALILGQRNSEWCGQGPVLEEDIALANISLDLIGQARTGMGKTFAFGVPLLHEITSDPDRPLTGAPRALVVVPTRELCLQVYNDLASAA